MIMYCSICGAPMTAEQDPHGTGDWCYVLYEPTCDCEEQEVKDDEESAN